MHESATTSSAPGQVDSAELVPFGRGVVQMLATAIEAKDPTTVGHVQRVARLADRIGRELGLGERAPHRPATGSVCGGNFGHGAGQVS